MATVTPEEARTQIVNVVRDFVRREVEPVAERLDREDTVPLDLIDQMKELGLFGVQTVYRDDVPFRTDMGKLPAYQTHKNTLYGRQEGHCAGCKVLFEIRNLTVDHIVARQRGGTDHLDNLQLLCGACNSMKGTKTQEEFLAALKQAGIGSA